MHVEGPSGASKKGGHYEMARTHKTWMAVLLGMGLLLMPVASWATEAIWIDEITALVKDHQELAKSEGRDEAYNPYLDQLMLVRITLESGTPDATRVAMNRLMDS